MRLSDEEEEDEDPVLRGKRLRKQWQHACSRTTMTGVTATMAREGAA